jgi:hypothetical protein
MIRRPRKTHSTIRTHQVTAICTRRTGGFRLKGANTNAWVMKLWFQFYREYSSRKCGAVVLNDPLHFAEGRAEGGGEGKTNIITAIFQPFACFKRCRRQNHSVLLLHDWLNELAAHTPAYPVQAALQRAPVSRVAVKYKARVILTLCHDFKPCFMSPFLYITKVSLSRQFYYQY